MESEIDAKKYRDNRGLTGTTVEMLIQRYREEIGAERPFGRNKAAVLATLEKEIGKLSVVELTDDALLKHIKRRRRDGAGGVTIGIELTYLAGVLKTAKEFWKLPVSLDPINSARAAMRHLRIETKSKERKRRPTQQEIDAICNWFDGKARQKVPMAEIIRFAVATAMRQGEIIRLKWADIDDEHRTITIRDRKHPTDKAGNDQEVPLLGDAWEIVQRQPRADDRIFPVTDGTVSTLFPRACNALGIEDLRFHDLRHEGVSRLFEQNYTIEQVALVSGHRDWKMLSRYVQLKARDLHRK